MSSKYLGDQFDIHGGGMDLKFPHHECEIAQSESINKISPPFPRKNVFDAVCDQIKNLFPTLFAVETKSVTSNVHRIHTRNSGYSENAASTVSMPTIPDLGSIQGATVLKLDEEVKEDRKSYS